MYLKVRDGAEKVVVHVQQGQQLASLAPLIIIIMQSNVYVLLTSVGLVDIVRQLA